MFEVFPGDGHCICTHSGCRDTPDGILDLVSILLRPSPGVHCTSGSVCYLSYQVYMHIVAFIYKLLHL